jgi:hypothetical protein
VTEFPSNSRSGDRNYATPDKPSGDSKRVSRVVEGTVSRRKTPLGKRFMQTFVGGDDAQTVVQYVFLEVIAPTIKDLVVDAITQSVERAMFGENARNGSARRTRSYVNYGRYSSPTPRDGARPDPREVSKKVRTQDFEEVIVETRHEAQDVIDALFELTSKYNQATVADLYDLVGTTGDFTDQNWGWRDLRGSSAVRMRDGRYLLDLPRPEALK